MQFLCTATTSGLLALALAAPGAAPAIAADQSSALIQLAQKADDPNAKDDENKGKGRRDGKEGGGERRGGEGGGERRGGDGGAERRGGGDRGDRGDRGGNRNADKPPAKVVAPPKEPPPVQRQVSPPPRKEPPPVQRQVSPPPRQEPPPVQRQVSPPPRKEPPPVQRQVSPPPKNEPAPVQRQVSPPLSDKRSKILEMRERLLERNRRDKDDQRRGFQRDDRRDDRRPPVQVERPDDRRDDRRPPIQVQRPDDRRSPSIVVAPQVQPRKLESFRDRFRSRVGEDRAIQDLRRGRDERVRERRERSLQASPFRNFEDLKSQRRERREGNRVIIEEPDNRLIIRDGGRTVIRSNERDRWNRKFRDVRRENRNGRDVSVAIGFGGAKIYEDFDDDGRARRRWRVGADGREVVLFDNSRNSRWRDRRGRPNGGVFDAIIDLPPPRLRIPRDEYIVDYDRASDDDLYDALSAPPVEEIDDRYSLDEIRSSYSVRDRMRRIDLDTINFEFGSWEVNEADYDRLERLARAMRRVLRNNPDETFLVEGHTDAVGSDEDNLTLSDRRAEAVAQILSDEFQVPQENMTTQGYGEQFLKIDTSGPERENRRVAVRRITPLLAR